MNPVTNAALLPLVTIASSAVIGALTAENHAHQIVPRLILVKHEHGTVIPMVHDSSP